MTKTLYRIDEAAEALSIGRTKLYELIRDGDIQTVSIGTARRIPADALANYVESIRRGDATEAAR